MNQEPAGHCRAVPPVFLPAVNDMTASKAEEISSAQNPRIKELVKLRERKARVASDVILVEGGREIIRAIAGGLQILECYFCGEQLSEAGRQIVEAMEKLTPQPLKFKVSKTAFAKAAMREGSDGVIVLAKANHHKLDDLSKKNNPILLAVEGVEKPGNLGALIRTADAIGVDGVIVLDNCCDVYSPNVIRASIGAVFHVPVVEVKSNIFLSYCRAGKLQVFGAALADQAIAYTKADFRNGAVILCGSEARGLSDFWLNHADQLIQIPMRGVGDSLNVSVAAAVIAFEASRQRS